MAEEASWDQVETIPVQAVVEQDNMLEAMR